MAVYCFCPTPELWERERGRALKTTHEDIGPYPSNLGTTISYGKGRDPRFMVVMDERVDEDPVLLVSTIAHESYHVVRGILECMADDNASEEFVAYLLGEVCHNIFAQYSLTRSSLARSTAERKS